jgi:hypothetical protein
MVSTKNKDWRRKMTEAEIIQKISIKQGELVKKQAENASAEVITAIQNEIVELTESLAGAKTVKDDRTSLDDCAR